MYQEPFLGQSTPEKSQDVSVRSGKSYKNNNQYREEVPFEILVQDISIE